MSVQSLQHYRVQVEEQLKMELAEVTQQLLQAEQSIARLSDDQRLQEERYREETRQQQWDEARAKLVAASQDRRTLDRLIARYREAALTEMRRREQMATDESAHHRFAGQGDALS
jgi:flagellar biosynthesis chaperone FliJ